MPSGSGYSKAVCVRVSPACFNGSPGTGKTESVYQLARQSGRDIMQVDISETKSMWFGESEKRIKEIFDRYRGYVRDLRSSLRLCCSTKRMPY